MLGGPEIFPLPPPPPVALITPPEQNVPLPHCRAPGAALLPNGRSFGVMTRGDNVPAPNAGDAKNFPCDCGAVPNWNMPCELIVPGVTVCHGGVVTPTDVTVPPPFGGCWA